MRFDFVKTWLNAKYEQELKTPQDVDMSKPADMIYPPPSAYEIKQINEEYGLDKFSCIQSIPPMRQWKLDTAIDRENNKK